LQFEELTASADKRINFLLRQLAAATRQLVNTRTAARGSSTTPPAPPSNNIAPPVMQQPAAGTPEGSSGSQRSSGCAGSTSQQMGVARDKAQHYIDKFAEMPGQLRQLESTLKSATAPVSRKQHSRRQGRASAATLDMPAAVLASQQLASMYGSIAKQLDGLVHVLEALPTAPGDGQVEGAALGLQGGSNTNHHNSTGAGKKSGSDGGSCGPSVGSVGGCVTVAEVTSGIVSQQHGAKAGGGGAADSGTNSSAGMPAAAAAAMEAARGREVSLQAAAAAAA
jgi:hypothetical protein